MCPKNISEAALFYDRFWSENDFFFSDHLHAKVAVKYLLRFDTTPPHFMLITKSSASVPQEFCVCVDKPIKSHSQLKLGWVVLRLSWFLSQAILRISNIMVTRLPFSFYIIIYSERGNCTTNTCLDSESKHIFALQTCKNTLAALLESFRNFMEFHTLMEYILKIAPLLRNPWPNDNCLKSWRVTQSF